MEQSFVCPFCYRKVEPARPGSIAYLHGLSLAECAFCASCDIHVKPIYGEVRKEENS